MGNREWKKLDLASFSHSRLPALEGELESRLGDMLRLLTIPDSPFPIPGCCEA